MPCLTHNHQRLVDALIEATEPAVLPADFRIPSLAELFYEDDTDYISDDDLMLLIDDGPAFSGKHRARKIM